MLLFSTISLAAGLGGCKQRFNNENLQVVNRQFEQAAKEFESGKRDAGVSPKEVESVMGPPESMSTPVKIELETQKKEVELVRYYYKQGGQTIEFHFLDNKLIAKVPLLGPPGTPDPKAPEGQP